MTQLAIVVLNWKQARLTVNTIESIKKITHRYFNYQIILVDNGSPDDSLSQLRQKYSSAKNITIIANRHNLGYVEGNNTGIRYALKHHFDYVLVINNDVLVKPDFLDKLVKQAKSNPKIAILGPKIYFAPGYEYHHHYPRPQLGKIIWSVGGRIDWQNILGSNIGIDEFDQGQYDHQNSSSIDFISGCCFLIKKTVFQKIGLFDPRYFLFLEDADFCQRAKKSAYQLAVVPSSVIWHLNSQTTGAGSHLHDYFLSRNRLLFGLQYAAARTKFALFRESLKIIFTSPSVWHKRGVIDFYRRKFGVGSWQ